MTASAFIVSEETSAIGHWRAYGLAVLPLALLGVMPVWSCLALCMVYALGVRHAQWAQLRLTLTLLLTALTAVVSVPEARQGGLASLVVLAVSYIVWTLSGVALNLGAQTLQDGQRRGLWPVLLAGLLAPQPLLLLALAGGLAARPGPDDRRTDRVRDSRVWSWGLAALVAGVLVATTLPQADSSWLTSRMAGNGATPGAGTLQSPGRTEAASRSPTTSAEQGITLPLQLQIEASGLLTPMTFLGVAGVCLLLGLATLLRLNVGGSGERRHPAEVLMALTLVLTAVVWLAVAALLNSGGGGGMGSGAADIFERLGRLTDTLARAPATRSVDLTPLLQLQLWLALAFTVALIVAVFARLRRGIATAGLRGPVPPDERAGVAANEKHQALHRVRVAYRDAEAALAESGRGRGPSETPASYASRIGGRDPVLAGALTILTGAYAPVRYGGRVTDEDADQADSALAELKRALNTLPPLDPDDVHGPSIDSDSSPSKESS